MLDRHISGRALSVPEYCEHAFPIYLQLTPGSCSLIFWTNRCARALSIGGAVVLLADADATGAQEAGPRRWYGLFCAFLAFVFLRPPIL